MLVVLGFWGSRPRDVGRYVDLYESIVSTDEEVFEFTAPVHALVLGPLGFAYYARILAKKLENKNFSSADETLSFHVLSNNGAMLLSSLFRFLNEDLKNRVDFVAADSCPGEMRANTFVKASLANAGVLDPSRRALAALCLRGVFWMVLSALSVRKQFRIGSFVARVVVGERAPIFFLGRSSSSRLLTRPRTRAPVHAHSYERALFSGRFRPLRSPDGGRPRSLPSHPLSLFSRGRSRRGESRRVDVCAPRVSSSSKCE